MGRDDQQAAAERLAAYGLTQAHIAASLGVSQPTISRWLAAATQRNMVSQLQTITWAELADMHIRPA